MTPRFIVIEGNIGAGKTTLSKMLQTDLNANLILEQFAENPFLPKFYTNPEKYSFPLELSFLADRYHQLKQELVNPSLFQQTIISDYYFTKSLIFSKSNLKNDEYKLYRRIFNIIYQSLPLPDLYVYLNTSTEQLLNNIKKRGRTYEQTITAEYLENIQQGYINYMKQEQRIAFLVVNTYGTDFVRNNSDYQLLKQQILNKKYNKGINNITISEVSP